MPSWSLGSSVQAGVAGEFAENLCDGAKDMETRLRRPGPDDQQLWCPRLVT